MKKVLILLALLFTLSNPSPSQQGVKIVDGKGQEQNIQSDGPPPVAYTLKFDYDASGNLIYAGFALSKGNPATSGSVWAIRKYTYDASNRVTTAQWASGDSNMDKVWDNRASLSYQ